MTETFQEQKAIEPPQVVEISFATIAAVYSDGIALIFDGQSEATDKHYKCNSSIVFTAGQRVKICKDSGTFIVEYPVGNPPTASNVTAYNVKNRVNAAYQNVKLGWNGTDFYICNENGSTFKKITVT